MLMQQETTNRKKNFQISLWQLLGIVSATLLSGGSLAALAPSQVAYANHSRSHIHSHARYAGNSAPTNVIEMLIVCEAGNGGKGGSTTENSSGAGGGPGGGCLITIPITVALTLQVTP
jgi:hypothetical protein